MLGMLHLCASINVDVVRIFDTHDLTTFLYVIRASKSNVHLFKENVAGFRDEDGGTISKSRS